MTAPTIDRSKSTGAVAAETVVRLRFNRRVERVHRLGPRPVGELLLELIKLVAPERRAYAHARVARYSALDPDVVRAVGGDQFAPTPIHAVSK